MKCQWLLFAAYCNPLAIWFLQNIPLSIKFCKGQPSLGVDLILCVKSLYVFLYRQSSTSILQKLLGISLYFFFAWIGPSCCLCGSKDHGVYVVHLFADIQGSWQSYLYWLPNDFGEVLEKLRVNPQLRVTENPKLTEAKIVHQSSLKPSNLSCPVNRSSRNHIPPVHVFILCWCFSDLLMQAVVNVLLSSYFVTIVFEKRIYPQRYRLPDVYAFGQLNFLIGLGRFNRSLMQGRRSL